MLLLHVEELDWSAQTPDHNPTKTIEINWYTDDNPGHLKPSVPDLTIAFVAKWAQIPIATLKNL